MKPHSQRQTGRPAEPAPAEAGFTLLETVIALFVTLVVGFGAIGLFLFSTSFNAGASDRARALAVAQEKMEQLRAQSYDTLVAGTDTETMVSGEANYSDLHTFVIETKIEDDATTSPSNRQKRITVNVSPENTGGRFNPGSVSVLMLRASDDIGDN